MKMVAPNDVDIIYSGKALANHTVSELKSILKQANKSLGGLKSDLIARMADYIRETDASSNGRSSSPVMTSSIRPDTASPSLSSSSFASSSLPPPPAQLPASPSTSHESSVVSAVIPPCTNTITTSASMVSRSHCDGLIPKYDELAANYTALMADTPVKSDALLALAKRLFDFASELHHLHINLPPESTKQIFPEPSDDLKIISSNNKHATNEERTTILNFITGMVPHYELQAMSREYGLPANGTRAAMVAGLTHIFSGKNLPSRHSRFTTVTQRRAKLTSKVSHAHPVDAKRVYKIIRTPADYYAARYASASPSGRFDPSSFVGLATAKSSKPVNLAPVEKILHLANNSPISMALYPAINARMHAFYAAAAASKFSLRR